MDRIRGRGLPVVNLMYRNMTRIQTRMRFWELFAASKTWRTPLMRPLTSFNMLDLLELRVSFSFRRSFSRADSRHFSIRCSVPERWQGRSASDLVLPARSQRRRGPERSEEHTSELQSRRDLVCRL